MIIIKNNYFLSNYILDGISSANKNKYDIIDLTFKDNYSKIKKFLTYHKFIYDVKDIFDESYLSRLDDCKKRHDTVLFFGVENLKNLILHRYLLPDHHFKLFLWNSLIAKSNSHTQRLKYINTLKNHGFDIYTFDEGDAHNYDLKLVRQPYRYCNHPIARKYDGDIFFIGKEKGRGTVLSSLYQLFTKSGFSTDFYILKEKHDKPLHDIKHLYHNSVMNYTEMLARLSSYRCYLEVRQKGQEGSSLRLLEAMFNSTKLISDNTNLVKSDLYDPSRILILDSNITPIQIKNFIATPFKSIDPGIMQEYEINTWINQFTKD